MRRVLLWPIVRYIAAYDTEKPRGCLEACRHIRRVHEKHDVPGTFFIVGKRLEEEGREYRSLLGDVSSFEIASHTYSHAFLLDHPIGGAAPEWSVRREEIVRSKKLVEDVFERPCRGLRPAWGFAEGFAGEPRLLGMLADAGYQYVSSLLWGPGTTQPALLRPPFPYQKDGHPELWELPGHGWHENLLKAQSLSDQPQRILAWPSPMPSAIRLGPVTTPEEEFTMNRVFIDRAVELDLPYLSFIWHPWSLHRFDPEMRMLELTFSYVRSLGMEPTTFEAEYARLSSPQPAEVEPGTRAAGR